MSDQESGDWDPLEKLAQVTLEVLEREQMYGREPGPEHLARVLAVRLSELTADALERAEPRHGLDDRIAFLRGLGRVWVFMGHVEFKDSKDTAGALIERSPLQALGDVLSSYDYLTPPAAQDALNAYRSALRLAGLPSVEQLIPTTLAPAPELTPEEVSRVYGESLEGEFFGHPWNDPQPSRVSDPAELQALDFYEWEPQAEGAPALCTLHKSQGGWVFTGRVQVLSRAGTQYGTFQRPCVDLGAAMSRVPWNRVNAGTHTGGTWKAVADLVTPFLLDSMSATDDPPEFLLNGELVIADSQREAILAELPVITVTRTTRNGTVQIHHLGGNNALDELATQDLHVLRRGEITEYDYRGKAQDLIDTLQLDLEGGDEDKDDWSDVNVRLTWEEDDDEISEYFAELPLVNRWASVRSAMGRGRLSGLALPGHEPTIIALDPPEGTVESGQDLAYYSWFSEGGGGPVSWAGGSRVTDLGHGWIMVRRWGDLDNSMEVLPGNSRPDQVASHVINLINEEECHIAAALALEPLDPDHTLPPNEREEWSELLGGLTVELAVDCDEEAARLIRRHLTEESASYRRARAALEQPNSALGQRFLRDLELAVSEDIPARLTHGAWLAED